MSSLDFIDPTDETVRGAVQHLKRGVAKVGLTGSWAGQSRGTRTTRRGQEAAALRREASGAIRRTCAPFERFGSFSAMP
jgi:hypothetical protein